jgi:hypothetical protein
VCKPSSLSPHQHHNSSLPVSPPLGDVDNRPKAEVFAVQRNVELAASRADLTLVLVALVGGDQSTVTPEEFQAHLSLRFRVSVGVAGVCAWLGEPFARECQQDGQCCIAMQGGKMPIQAVHPEPELVVDRCLEVQRWDFDPMLVEVEACLTKRLPQTVLMSQAMLEVAQAVDLCLSGPDECGSGQTSPRPSLLVLE